MTTGLRLRLGGLGAIACLLLGSSIVLAFEDHDRELRDSVTRAGVRVEAADHRLNALEEQGLRNVVEAKLLLAAQAEMRRQIDEMQWLLRFVVGGLGMLLAEAVARLLPSKRAQRDGDD